MSGGCIIVGGVSGGCIIVGGVSGGCIIVGGALWWGVCQVGAL